MWKLRSNEELNWRKNPNFQKNIRVQPFTESEKSFIISITTCRSGGTGRRAAFRAQWEYSRAGSNPAFGTMIILLRYVTVVFDFYGVKRRIKYGMS
jgi:hypothetical protein